MALRPKGQKDGISTATGQKDGDARSHEGSKARRSDGGEQNLRRCYNYGGQGHVGANCPTKESGVKCFRCNERGHVAAKCTGKVSTKDSCAVSEHCDKKYYKDVRINDCKVLAMIDTGSDVFNACGLSW